MKHATETSFLGELRQTVLSNLHQDGLLTKTVIISFNQECEWLEKEGDLKSVEIHLKMVEMAASIDKVYTKNWLKLKLKDKYQDHIFLLR